MGRPIIGPTFDGADMETAERVQPDDAMDLLEASRRGDAAAFGVLVARYQRMIHALTYRMTGSEADASDLAQDAFVQAWRRLGDFRGDAQFSSWLYRIAMNQCLNWRAREAREARARQQWADSAEWGGSRAGGGHGQFPAQVGGASPASVVDSTGTTEEFAGGVRLGTEVGAGVGAGAGNGEAESWGEGRDAARAAWVREALLRLPAKQRAAVVLTVYDGMKHAEAAAVLGCSEATVSWRVFAAKTRLKRWMKAFEAEERNRP